MKALLSMAAFLMATSAFAATVKIDCDDNSNSDQMMSIFIDSETTRVEGISLYNVDWSQTAEATYKKATAIGTVNPMAGIRVYFPNNQNNDMYANYVDIDYSVFEKDHDGAVKLNGQDNYQCF